MLQSRASASQGDVVPPRTGRLVPTAQCASRRARLGALESLNGRLGFIF